MATHALTHTAVAPRPVADLGDIAELAQQFRVDAIRMSTAAGSGHPTSAMSAAELIAVLAARYLRYDWRRPDDPANDHLTSPRATRPRCCVRCSKRPGWYPTSSS